MKASATALDFAEISVTPVRTDSDDAPLRNQLLAALPASEFERLRPHLELVTLRRGEMLYESGNHLHQAYFPATCIISVFHMLESGAPTGIAIVGNEGLFGIALCLGGQIQIHCAVVQSTGQAYRLQSQQLLAEFTRSPAFQRLLLRYAGARMALVAQQAACNRHHSVSQQVSSWLLGFRDRSDSNALVLTHELIGSALGIRRESVSAAAEKLQAAGIVHCSRRLITVLDPARLEAQACPCHRILRSQADRLLPAGA